MKRSARLIFALATTAALLPPAGARAATVDVSIRSGGNEFHPSEIVVHVGDSVRWTNDDRTLFQTDHNVMADDGSFASKQRMKEGSSYEFQFTKAGTFTYHCTIHDWSGTVEVLATQPTHVATASPTPTTTPTQTKRPRPSRSASPSPTADASAGASSAPSIDPSGVGSSLPSSTGTILSIAIVSIVALALLGWFVYVRFVRQD